MPRLTRRNFTLRSLLASIVALAAGLMGDRKGRTAEVVEAINPVAFVGPVCLLPKGCKIVGFHQTRCSDLGGRIVTETTATVTMPDAGIGKPER